MAPALEFFLLGPFEARFRGERLARSGWGTRKVKLLLQILLTFRGRAVHLEELCEWLWPGAPPHRARHNLHVAVSRLRRILALDGAQDHVQVAFGDESYRLADRGEAWLDVEEFLAELERGRELAQQGHLRPAIAALERGVDLRRGDYLEEERYADWALASRERCREAYLEGLLLLSDLYAANGQLLEAVAACQPVLQLDPLRESAYRRLMAAYYQLGDRAQALQVYERCRRLLAEELGIEPLQETSSLYASVLEQSLLPPSERARLPEASRVVEAAGGSGSRELLPFLGRSEELRRLEESWQRLLSGRGGMVLLLGEEGMGKTRLAAQFARRLRERGYPVLSAGALATEGHLPFALAAQLLREPGGAGAKAGPERREADPAPETRPPPAGEPMDRLLARLAKRVGSRPALMVADDLERADRGSLAFLHRALTTRPQGLLLVGTCRPYELQPDSPLAELVQELGKEGRLEEIVLHPLPREDVEDWLAEALPAADPEDLSDLLTLSEGVPWLLHELLANLPGWAYSHAGRRLPLGSVPPAVRAAVRRRIAWLTPEGRRVLQMASLLGQGWSHVPLGALWDGGREELVGGLEACLESGLVVEEGWRSGRYRFSRELYRRAVEAEISTARYGLWRERLRLGLNRPAEARGRLPRTLGRFSL